MLDALRRRARLTGFAFHAICAAICEDSGMTGTRLSSAGLDARRRKALFRSWHRGMREVDLVLGTFADAEIASLTEEEMDQYERLLDVPDGDLLRWFIGERPVPETFQTSIMKRILASRRSISASDTRHPNEAH
jgi:antitoxin CptB